MKQFLLFLLAAWTLTACASRATPSNDLPIRQPINSMPNQSATSSTPAENPYAPHSSDGRLSRGKVYVEFAQIRTLESDPLQVQLNLKGNLPTPCHELRVEIKAPDSENKIRIEAYSLTDASKICTQILKPFEADISLGSFPSGHYTVWVNDKQVGEFDA